MCVSVEVTGMCMCVHVCVGAHRCQKRASDSPGAGVIDSYEPLDTDAGNRAKDSLNDQYKLLAVASSLWPHFPVTLSF